MNKKGFTLVELITTFALAAVIMVLLINIVVLIKNIYTNTSTRTELLIKQANLSNVVNSKLQNGKIKSYTDCSSYNDSQFYYSFELVDGSNIDFKKVNNKIIFGDYTYESIDGVSISTPIVNSDMDIFSIKLPIEYKLYNDEDFGINFVYLGSITRNSDNSVCQN